MEGATLSGRQCAYSILERAPAISKLAVPQAPTMAAAAN